MKSISLFMLFTVILSGCATLNVREEVVGVYVAKNGDFINIEKNGLASWSPLSKTHDNAVIIGYLNLDKKGIAGHFVAPDTSPYIGTVFRFSSDFKTLSVDWHTYRGSVELRATKYEMNQ